MNQYDFKPGSRLMGDAQAVGAWLNGHTPLTAADVVAAAKPKSHVLHGYFEWDDGAAADEYRLTQARHLLRSVVILREEEDDHPAMRVVEFVPRTADDAEEDGMGQYHLTVKVMRTPELAARVKARLRVELSVTAEKLRQYDALSQTVERRVRSLDRALEIELDKVA